MWGAAISLIAIIIGTVVAWIGVSEQKDNVVFVGTGMIIFGIFGVMFTLAAHQVH